jgi:hypothetical protein
VSGTHEASRSADPCSRDAAPNAAPTRRRGCCRQPKSSDRSRS